MGRGGGIRARDQLVKCGLARWSGDDLIVSFYDLDSERGYQDKRIRAAAGGRASAAKKHEKRDHLEASDFGHLGSSGSFSQDATCATSTQSRGSERRGEASEAERSAEEERSEEDSASRLPAHDSPEIPRDPDEAVSLFRELHRELLGASYVPTPTDTLAIRSNWDELAHNELRERIRAYLVSGPNKVPSMTGFLGWHR
jgi:hypothetical protein